MPIREIVVDQETQQRKLFFWAESIAKLDDFESWVSELSTQEQEKIARLLKQCLSHTSPLLHHSKEKFRKELDAANGGIWAIKCGQIRIFGVRRGMDFHIIHFIIKKDNKLTQKDKNAINEKFTKYSQ